jgi:branched-chain amino acid transport system substrate-binding protein
MDGRKVDFVFCDDKTNPTEASRCVTQLISDEKVVAIIGPGTGSGILAAGRWRKRCRCRCSARPAPSRSTDKANAFFPWIFRIAPNDTAGMESLWKQIVSKGAKKVAIDLPGGRLREVRRGVRAEAVEGLGFTIVESRRRALHRDRPDPAGHEVPQRGAESVFMQLSVTSLGASFLKAVNEVGLKVPLYANSGLAQKGFIDAPARSAKACRCSSIGNVVYDPTPPEQKLVAIMAKNGFKPQGWGDCWRATAT